MAEAAAVRPPTIEHLTELAEAVAVADRGGLTAPKVLPAVPNRSGVG